MNGTFRHISQSPAAGEGFVTVGRGQSLRSTVVVAPDGGDAVPPCFIVEEGASAEIVVVVLPGVSGDIALRAVLAGEHSEVSVSGLYVCTSDERVNLSAEVYHDVPNCVSRQQFRGIAGGKSRIGFSGKVVVAPDAQKTEAAQENHNLLLSADAVVDTKPQLEIYADDVKCSHGATTGRLDEDEQFYMRSRGISLEEARLLQLEAFIAPVLGLIADPALHDSLSASLSSALRRV